MIDILIRSHAARTNSFEGLSVEGVTQKDFDRIYRNPIKLQEEKQDEIKDSIRLVSAYLRQTENYNVSNAEAQIFFKDLLMEAKLTVTSSKVPDGLEKAIKALDWKVQVISEGEPHIADLVVNLKRSVSVDTLVGKAIRDAIWADSHMTYQQFDAIRNNVDFVFTSQKSFNAIRSVASNLKVTMAEAAKKAGYDLPDLVSIYQKYGYFFVFDKGAYVLYNKFCTDDKLCAAFPDKKSCLGFLESGKAAYVTLNNGSLVLNEG